MRADHERMRPDHERLRPGQDGRRGSARTNASRPRTGAWRSRGIAARHDGRRGRGTKACVAITNERCAARWPSWKCTKGSVHGTMAVVEMHEGVRRGHEGVGARDDGHRGSGASERVATTSERVTATNEFVGATPGPAQSPNATAPIAARRVARASGPIGDADDAWNTYSASGPSSTSSRWWTLRASRPLPTSRR